jgi:hypothetical protein
MSLTKSGLQTHFHAIPIWPHGYVLLGFLSLLMTKNTLLFPALLDNYAAANLDYFLIF